VDDPELKLLSAIEQKVLWLSCWTIHNANHLREKSDGLKVGGHQASSASMVSIMTALYFAVLWPQDRIAVSPMLRRCFTPSNIRWKIKQLLSVPIEHLHKLGKIHERAAEAVNLVDNDHVDQQS
jgi:hypothetical protein